MANGAGSVSLPILMEQDGIVPPELGGRSSEPCFCLLDGFFCDPEDQAEKARVTIPITKIPATLGRTHENNDPNFFGLGEKKALSRTHFRISYRDSQGGTAEFDHRQGKLAYYAPKQSSNSRPERIVGGEDFPERGCFVVECLGKNRIYVNHGRVDQGNAAILTSGSAIRVSSYTLYFLLPKDVEPSEYVVILEPSSALSSLHNTKKRKIGQSPGSGVTVPAPSPLTSKISNLQDDLDCLSTEILLNRMTEAVDAGVWERKHGMLAAAIAVRAAKDAALDPEIGAKGAKAGIARTDFMQWIEKSPQYSEWVKQINTKMEPRSYQALMTKTLLKAGYTRTGSSGRYVKWLLPAEIPLPKNDNNTGFDGDMKEEEPTSDKDEASHSKGDEGSVLEEYRSDKHQDNADEEPEADQEEENKVEGIDEEEGEDDDDDEATREKTVASNADEENE
jgi:FHA domain